MVAHFKVTAVAYHCNDNNTDIVVTLANTMDAPRGVLWPIDDWWVRSGRTYRTPFMTGSKVRVGP